MKLAYGICKIRETYGLSQADIAYKVNISPQAYSKIERNAKNYSIETLEKIANAIGVDLIFLLDIESNLYEQEKTTYRLLKKLF